MRSATRRVLHDRCARRTTTKKPRGKVQQDRRKSRGKRRVFCKKTDEKQPQVLEKSCWPPPSPRHIGTLHRTRGAVARREYLGWLLEAGHALTATGYPHTDIRGSSFFVACIAAGDVPYSPPRLWPHAEVGLMVGLTRDSYAAGNRWLSLVAGADFDAALIIEPVPLRHAPLPPPVNLAPKTAWRDGIGPNQGPSPAARLRQLVERQGRRAAWSGAGKGRITAETWENIHDSAQRLPSATIGGATLYSSGGIGRQFRHRTTYGRHRPLYWIELFRVDSIGSCGQARDAGKRV
jgi:hypothetical protein